MINQGNPYGQIMDFYRNFKGDPQKQLQELINSGRVPQNALNEAQRQAKPIYDALKTMLGGR